MPRSKPRWGWRPKGLAKAPKRPYNEDDIIRMANILGLSDSVEIARLEAELQDHGYLYLVAKVNFNAGPRPVEMKAALKVLQRQLEAVQSTLDRLDLSSRNTLERTSREASNSTDEIASNYSPLYEAEKRLDLLHKWTQESSAALPPHWPRNGARFLFVYGLAQIFQNITGERPTRRYRESRDTVHKERLYGPFKTFVVAALEPIDHTAVQGIDDVIKDCLKVFPNMG